MVKEKNGFTLIELLAVIIILGVLMIIAIPSVTEYIQSSRKNAYVSTASSYVDGARTKINSAEVAMFDTTATYYLPTSCIALEKGGDSPFGELEEGYVVVVYDGNKYDYYFTARDSSNMGILLTSVDLLDTDKIVSGIESLDTTVAIEGTKKIVMVEDCKSSVTEKPSTSVIPKKGSFEQKTESITKETPYWGRLYTCIPDRSPDNSYKIAFYSDGYNGIVSSNYIVASNAATIGYSGNKLLDSLRPGDELGEVLENGRKIRLYDSMDIAAANCTLDSGGITLNAKYVGVMEQDGEMSNVSVIFLEDGSAMITNGDLEGVAPPHTFMYGSDFVYNALNSMMFPVLDNGNKVDSDGVIVTIEK